MTALAEWVNTSTRLRSSPTKDPGVHVNSSRHYRMSGRRDNHQWALRAGDARAHADAVQHIAAITKLTKSQPTATLKGLVGEAADEPH